MLLTYICIDMHLHTYSFSFYVFLFVHVSFIRFGYNIVQFNVSTLHTSAVYECSHFG